MKLAGDEGEVDNIGDCGNKKGLTFFRNPGALKQSIKKTHALKFDAI